MIRRDSPNAVHVSTDSRRCLEDDGNRLVLHRGIVLMVSNAVGVKIAGKSTAMDMVQVDER